MAKGSNAAQQAMDSLALPPENFVEKITPDALGLPPLPRTDNRNIDELIDTLEPRLLTHSVNRYQGFRAGEPYPGPKLLAYDHDALNSIGHPGVGSAGHGERGWIKERYDLEDRKLRRAGRDALKIVNNMDEALEMMDATYGNQAQTAQHLYLALSDKLNAYTARKEYCINDEDCAPSPGEVRRTKELIDYLHNAEQSDMNTFNDARTQSEPYRKLFNTALKALRALPENGKAVEPPQAPPTPTPRGVKQGSIGG